MMQTTGLVRCRANVEVAVWDARTRRLLRRERKHNLVVTAGRNLLVSFLNGSAPAALSHFAIGTGTTPVTASDTTLATEVFRDAITSKTTASGQITVQYFLASTQANGNTLAEAGIFNDPTAGTMYARVVLASSIAKTSAIEVTFSWVLSFST